MRIISRSLEEAEILVAEERAGLKRDFDLWRHAAKERAVSRVTSARGAAVAAAVGLLMTVLMRRRSRDRPRHAPAAIAPETKRKGLAAILGGLVVTGLRMRYGNPWNALPIFLAWSRDRYARRYANRPVRHYGPRAAPPGRVNH